MFCPKLLLSISAHLCGCMRAAYPWRTLGIRSCDNEWSHTVQFLDCSDLNWRCNHYHHFGAVWPFWCWCAVKLWYHHHHHHHHHRHHRLICVGKLLEINLQSLTYYKTIERSQRGSCLKFAWAIGVFVISPEKWRKLYSNWANCNSVHICHPITNMFPWCLSEIGPLWENRVAFFFFNILYFLSGPR